MHNETLEEHNKYYEEMRRYERARKSADETMRLRQSRDSRKESIDDLAKQAMLAIISTGKFSSTKRWEVAKAAKAFADAMIVTLEEE